MFLQSRKEDASVKEREHALQSLDLAYYMYKEITRNLDEGIKVGLLLDIMDLTGVLMPIMQFYNDFSGILAQFKETCKGWANHRRNEMQ